MARETMATLRAEIDALKASLAAAPAGPSTASQHSLSQLREAGAFDCGITGHGKNDDGHFATRGGATFHAQTCKAMAKVLKAK